MQGQPHEVSVELDGAGQPVHVAVDGSPCTVQIGADQTLLVRTQGDDGPQHTVHLSPGRRPAHAATGGEVLELDVKSTREAALEAAMASASDGGGGGTIAAPMPGRVVRVLVATGDQVEADAPLLIVEAMKMENEVRSPAAGIVRSIAVAAGDTVEAGQPLCDIAAVEDQAD